MAKTTTTKRKPVATKKSKPSNGPTLTMVNAAITAMVAASGAFGQEATKASIMALTHCSIHGDATGIERLYTALGGTGQRVGPDRQKALMRWLTAYSPVRRNNKTGVFGLLKSNVPNYVPFNLDDAEATPFLDFEPDRSRGATVFSNEMLAKRITAMFKKDYADNWEGPALNRAAIVAAVETALTAE